MKGNEDNLILDYIKYMKTWTKKVQKVYTLFDVSTSDIVTYFLKKNSIRTIFHIKLFEKKNIENISIES